MVNTKSMSNGRQSQKKVGQLTLVLTRMSKNRAAMLGLFIFIILVFLGIFAPYLTPYNYDQVDATMFNATPSLAHPLGCDNMGRDILTRCFFGIRYSLSLGLIASAISCISGMILGALAGYFGGAVDMIILRIADIVQGIPNILMAIAISTVLGGGFMNTVLAMSLGGIPQATRLMRANIIGLHDEEYIEAARSINCRKSRIIFKHAVPNAFAPLIVSLTMGIGGTISGAAMLSYIGLGVRPPSPEWGAMLSAAQDLVRTYPHMIMGPGLFILITVLALNMLGDGLRDAMDPKQKK